MIIGAEKPKGVVVQVRDIRGEKKSRSITIRNATVDGVFNRLAFIYQELYGKKDGKVKMTHYKEECDENG